ncbi:MAG: SMC-Scp complex subunit ScpB [Myxococcota bacterium]|nr:SMC-Scp complex subunit ScpB [Myxococcota bacterium]
MKDDSDHDHDGEGRPSPDAGAAEPPASPPCCPVDDDHDHDHDHDHESTVTAGPAPARIEYDDETLSRLLEALLFVSQKPVPLSRLARALRTTYAAVRRGLRVLEGRLSDHGVRLAEIAGAYQIRTAPEASAAVQRFLDVRPVRLSKAAIETLAIVAYRQPATKPDVDDVRGVDSGSAVKLLLDRGLVRILGRKEEPGRPLLYGTTAAFLEFFGLSSLRDLPTLRDFADLTEESRRQLERDLFAPAPSPPPEIDDLRRGRTRRWDGLVEALGDDIGDLPDGVEVMPEDGQAAGSSQQSAVGSQQSGGGSPGDDDEHEHEEEEEE